VEAEPRTPDSPFWVEADAVERDRLRLSAEESHHLLHVFRAAPGISFEAVDGAGHCYRCVLESTERGLAVARITVRRDEAGELPAAIRVLAGLPAPAAAEELVARAVPLGATQLHFFAAAQGGKAGRAASRMARFDRLARAALKQSRRSRLPRIQFHASLEEALPAVSERCRVLADPDGGSWSRTAPQGVLEGVAVAVGPPGGLAAPERASLLASGFVAISLGPSRLTTQDAAIALVALAREGILGAGTGRH
jgi:16S rRNA (uracil1498-N3)-methyltransferase